MLTDCPREKLPYLGAVIQEGLRLSYGVAIRTARVATEETLVYRGEWNKKPVECIVPPGYAIGMSAVITHHDESVFPNSDAFIPERWLDDGQTLAALNDGRVRFHGDRQPLPTTMETFVRDVWKPSYQASVAARNEPETFFTWSARA